MANLLSTYKTIGHILDPKFSIQDLKAIVTAPNFDWDAIVVHGSQHLVLPAIYCQLHSKNLLECLPEALQGYLNEITEINRNRNKKILVQIQAISQLLSHNSIKHCFLKGAALITSQLYNDIAERMIGDIDILIDSEQIDLAFELLKANGYDKTYGYNYTTKGHRHLDRLIKTDELAAVELHRSLLNENREHLFDSKKMLKNCRFIEDMPVPSNDDMIEHLIVAFQINDKGYYYNSLSFKSCYDVLLVKSKNNYKDTFSENIASKYIESYMVLMHLFFENVCLKKPESHTIRQTIFLLKLKYGVIRFLLNTTKHIALTLYERIHLLFFNLSYRRRLFVSIFRRA